MGPKKVRAKESGEKKKRMLPIEKGGAEDTFKASRWWFDNFKKRSGIHSVVRHGEAASADVKGAERYIVEFAELLRRKATSRNKSLTAMRRDYFGKKCHGGHTSPKRRTKMPGHKPMKDRLTLALCANASGDCKVKPLLVYHSENPRAFKSHKILKEKTARNVARECNMGMGYAAVFFTDWVNLVFGPSVKEYLQKNNLPLKALLILDNAPAHPPGLQDDILEEFQFVKVLYLPPNTTSILQPMDQQVIANFKKLSQSTCSADALR
ncbi:tigger transposable element-derived protein 1-like [Macrobrachium nipponense]|uniref:tigger transposable element-derived protein 1-like n=1 Tax=Macrobrachium nipponense TaxID=159736 RepID=UPI0030C827D6